MGDTQWSPYLAISGLNWEDRDLLQQIKRYWGELKNSLDLSKGYNQRKQESLTATQQALQTLHDRPYEMPRIYYRAELPPVTQLTDGQKYLLYQWNVEKLHGERLYAKPIWIVVTERSLESRHTLHRQYDIVVKDSHSQ